MGGSWLRALGEAEKLQRPLRWTAHHAEAELSEEGTVATGGAWRSAVCGDHEMRRGQHYATFTLRTLGYAMLGVVGAGFDPTTAGGPAHGSAQGWLLFTADGSLATGSGDLYHAGRECNWEGQPEEDELKEGDVVVRPPLRLFACPAHTVWRRACCLTSKRLP